MATLDRRKLAGRLDRRIKILGRVESTDEWGEKTYSSGVLLHNVAAGKNEGGSSEGESGQPLISAKTVTTWETRWLNARIDASMKIEDEYGTKYEIIAPPTEIGRRAGLLIKTMQIE